MNGIVGSLTPCLFVDEAPHYATGNLAGKWLIGLPSPQYQRQEWIIGFANLFLVAQIPLKSFHLDTL